MSSRQRFRDAISALHNAKTDEEKLTAKNQALQAGMNEFMKLKPHSEERENKVAELDAQIHQAEIHRAHG